MQWHGENEPGNGLICGYEKAIGSKIPTFRWNGNLEIRDESLLDCKKTRNPTPTVPEARITLEEAPTLVAEEAQPATQVEEDWKKYPEIFKVQLNDTYYCGAREKGAFFSDDMRKIETWQKAVTDGNYLHDNSNSGMGRNAFCGGTAENGKPWTMVLLESNGFRQVEFPLQ